MQLLVIQHKQHAVSTTILRYTLLLPNLTSIRLLMLFCREIGDISGADMAHNTEGARNIAQFLSLLAEALPVNVLVNLHLLLPLLDSEVWNKKPIYIENCCLVSDIRRFSHTC